MLQRRIFIATPLASALLSVGFSAYAQRVTDTFADTFDTLAKPVPVALDSAKGEKTEIRQFFAYWCNHCANLEPSMFKWEKTMPKSFKLVRTPVAFQPNQKGLATLFYVLDTLPNSADLHLAVFSAIHNTRILNPNATEDQLRAFAIKTLNVPKDTVDAAWSSFGIQTKLRQSSTVLETYDINGIPAFVVQGRYQTSPARIANSKLGVGLRSAALYDVMFKEIERAALATAS